MKQKFYNISSGFIKHSGLLNSIVFERFILRKETGFSTDIYFTEIHPYEIGYISLFSGSSPLLIGTQASTGMYHGIFDFFKSPFNKHFMYQTVQSMLLGKNIHDTEYYRKLLKSMNQNEAAVRVRKLELLMKIFRETGYKSQYELGNMQMSRSIGQHKVPVHEMIVGMDRYGRFFRLVGGRHRLAIAQHLGLEKISAVISLMHKDAMDKLPGKSRVVRSYPDDYMPFI